MASSPLEDLLKDGLKGSLKERFKQRRGKLEIVIDILTVALGGAGKTEIVYKANLNFARIDRYIPFLKERGLLENSGSVYKTTEKGEELLRGYTKMKELLLT
jgi:predicted transcriptional regulator